MVNRWAVLMLSALLVAGCGKSEEEKKAVTIGPSAVQMRDAVGANIKADVDARLAQARGRQHLAGFQGFTAFTKKGCQPLEGYKSAWSCAFSMGVKINGREISREHSGTFTLTPQGAYVFKPDAPSSKNP